MSSKKILSATLAGAMIISCAPNVYASDIEVIIDPLGTVYEMEDEILQVSDGEINHGESFYLMLVDEATGSPDDIYSGDVDNLRIYTDWEIGESRVNDEDILYKKAEDVIVSSTVVPSATYKLNVSLIMPGESTAFATVNGVTKADGTGWTTNEIASLSEADKDEIISRALSTLQIGDASLYQDIMLSFDYEEVLNPYVYNGVAYASESEFLSTASATKLTTSHYAYPATNPTHYTNNIADATAGYTQITSPIYNWNNSYYTSLDTAKEAAFDDSSNTAIQELPSGTPHNNATVYIGYEFATGQHIVTTGGNTLYVNADPSSFSEIGNLSTNGVVSGASLSGSSAFVWASSATLTAGDSIMITADATPPSNATYNTNVTTIPSGTSDFFVKNSDGTFTYTTSGYQSESSSAIYTSSDYIVGSFSASTNGAYYNTSTNTYYADKTTALNAFTPSVSINSVTTGYYSDNSGVITYKTEAELYRDLTASEVVYVSSTSAFPVAVSSALNVSRPASEWRDKTTFAVLTDITTALTTAHTQVQASATIQTLSQGEQLSASTTATSGTAILSGSDYYYFVEIETESYTGADAYDVVGYVAVGTSSSDAEDKGETEVSMLLTAGEYDYGNPQDGDIEIYGEDNAIVEFEEDAGEIYIIWDDEAMFIVDISNQDDLNLGYNTDFDSEFADRHGYANIDFLNFIAEPRFNRNGDFYIYADEDMYIYQLNEDGFAEEISGLEYDEDEEAWTFRTNQLTSYVIADEELVLTDEYGNIEEPEEWQEEEDEALLPTDVKPNPETGR